MKNEPANNISAFQNINSTSELQEQEVRDLQDMLSNPNEKQKLTIALGTLKGLYKLFISISNDEVRNDETALLNFFNMVCSMEEPEVRTFIENIWKKAETDLNQEDLNKLIDQVYKRPQNYVMPTTKVTSQIFEKQKTDVEYTVVSGRKKSDSSVQFQVFVGWDEQTDITLPQNLTAYDREVFNGLCSILESGQSFCTSKQIYEAMAGKASRSPQAEARVTRSMRKLMTTLITLDWTNHAKMKGIELKEGEGVHTEENMIYAQAAFAKINGQKIQGYKIMKEPALLKYAKTVGQITTINRKYLKLDSINNTENSIVLKNYIIRRIETMKNSRNNIKNNTIILKTMFNSCNIDGSKAQMKRHRDVVFNILKELQNLNYIKGYTEKKERQSIIGIIIDL